MPSPTGDVTGTYAATTVTGLHFGSTGIPLSSTAPTSGQCLSYDGASIGGTSCGSGGGVNAIFIAGIHTGWGNGNTGIGLNGAYHAGATDLQTSMPVACTAKNLRVVTLTSQPGDGSLVISLGIGGTAQALSITVPASGSAGVYTDTSDTVPLSVGDLVNYVAVNNSASSSATVETIAIQCN
jgi:hypothetical protein